MTRFRQNLSMFAVRFVYVFVPDAGKSLSEIEMSKQAGKQVREGTANENLEHQFSGEHAGLV